MVQGQSRENEGPFLCVLVLQEQVYQIPQEEGQAEGVGGHRQKHEGGWTNDEGQQVEIRAYCSDS